MAKKTRTSGQKRLLMAEEEMLTMAIKGLGYEIERLKSQVRLLEDRLAKVRSKFSDEAAGPVLVKTQRPAKRVFSTATRKRMSVAQKKRWARRGATAAKPAKIRAVG